MSELAVLVALALVGIAILVFQRVVDRQRSDVWRVKSPNRSHWLWGNEKEVFDRSCGDAYSEWLDQLGPVIKIDGALWHGDILIPADPAALSHILSRNVYDYVKSPSFRPLVDRILGKSLTWAEGDDHRRMKGVLAHAFTADKVREMENVVLQSAQGLATAWRNHAVQETENAGQEAVTIDILGWPSRATLDIIGWVGFDHDFKLGISPEARSIIKLWRHQVNLGLTRAGFIAPLVLRALPFINSLPFKSLQAQGAIKMHIRLEGGGKNEGKDLLSFIARVSVKQNANGQEKGMDIDELLDHINTFVLTGHETTSGVLNYTFHALGDYPEYQDALRAELEAFGREPTYEDYTNPNTKGLEWLDAITKEAMRMFTPSAHTERVALKDDVMPLSRPILGSDGSVLSSLKIKKGQWIYIPSLSINTCTSIWGPTGPTFSPPRWLPPSHPYFTSSSHPPPPPPLPKAVLGGWSNLMSFSEGPRMCIGYRLALFEYKAILAAVIRAGLTFHGTGEQVQSRFSGTMQPFVVGREAEGSILPVRIGVVKD